MSSERGNTSRVRPQKHKNKQVFNNLRYDTNHRSKQIANTDVVQVCAPCTSIIEWKIKYKKYKPLSQAKTCIKCHQKTVKNSYHTVCLGCSASLDVCCKCGKKAEVVKVAQAEESVQLKEKAALEAEVKRLPLRRRKTFYRYMDMENGVRPKRAVEDLETEEEMQAHEDMLRSEAMRALSHSEYMAKAYAKLEELKKHTKLRHTFDDDFDDLSLCDEGEEDDEDDEDSEN